MAKQNTTSECKISRWELLKQKLNNLSPKNFQDYLQQNPIDSFTLIDCRTAEEFKTGFLPGAINVDYLSYGLLEFLEKLDPDKKYLVYCRSGRRSIRTCTLMKNGGFSNIINLDGGLVKWEADLGLPKLVS